MKALILAAGLGSRLREITAHKPKALVEVEGKPIIDYQVEALLENGITQINIVVGYLGHMIIEHFEKHWQTYCQVTFRNNSQYDDSNSSYSFWLANDMVRDGSYIHLNCDIIVFGKTLSELINCDYDDVIVLDTKIQLSDNMEQVLLDGNRIIEMRNTILPGAVGKAVGVAKFSPTTITWVSRRIEEYIEAGDKNQNFYGILREAVHHVSIYVLPTKESILEINSVSDLEKANRNAARPLF